MEDGSFSLPDEVMLSCMVFVFSRPSHINERYIDCVMFPTYKNKSQAFAIFVQKTVILQKL